MEQDQYILQSIVDQRICTPAQCLMGVAVYREFQRSAEVESVVIDYEPVSNEIYLKISRNGTTSYCLVRSVHDNLDFTTFTSFRKALQLAQNIPILLAVSDYTQTILLYDIHNGGGLKSNNMFSN